MAPLKELVMPGIDQKAQIEGRHTEWLCESLKALGASWEGIDFFF